MAIETVTGSRVVIRFDPSRCIHSRNCVLSHPDVFVPNVEANGSILMRCRPRKWRWSRATARPVRSGTNASTAPNRSCG
jgi:hypothetical protein